MTAPVDSRPASRSSSVRRLGACPCGLLAAASALALLAGCTVNMQRIYEAPSSLALTTTGPWNSMIYLARTDSGVIAIDLGWIGARSELAEGLEALNATPRDVASVFLTHSHRDHVAAWESVRHAAFYMGAAEVPLFTAQAEHAGPVPDLLADLVPAELPAPGELDVRPLTGDTTLVLGSDTLRAFLVPGHTAGSTAYLFRGVLFVGDALGHTPVRGFHSAKWMYSESVDRSRASVAALWGKVEGLDVRYVCTAHGKCAPPDSVFRREALR